MTQIAIVEKASDWDTTSEVCHIAASLRVDDDCKHYHRNKDYILAHKCLECGSLSSIYSPISDPEVQKPFRIAYIKHAKLEMMYAMKFEIAQRPSPYRIRITSAYGSCYELRELKKHMQNFTDKFKSRSEFASF